MNIKIKLSFRFTLLVSLILVFFSLLTYYFSYTSQESKFRTDLFEKARNTAILLVNVEEVDSTLLKKIHQSTHAFEKEEIAIVNAERKIIYGNNMIHLSRHIIESNLPDMAPRYFSIGKYDGVSYSHSLNNHKYYVFVLAFDMDRVRNLKELRDVLVWSILFSMWLSVLFSYLFSRNAMQPISEIIRNVKQINSSRLSARLHEGNKKDEIAQLAITFNGLLSNLEVAFKNQEDFVANASHELRTPLSVMIGETDYLLSQPRLPHEYLKHLENVGRDLREMNDMVNSLLELAQINGDHEIPMSSVRIDEVVQAAIQQLKGKYVDRKIILKIDYPDDENDLVITGEQGLLLVATKNLIDNSCKFSNDDVVIGFEVGPNRIKISVSDRGIGIPANEMGDVFRPFARASNVKYKSGFGIGLALVEKIIKLHHGELRVLSDVGQGTTFEMVFDKENC